MHAASAARIRPADRFSIAVSGGADSLALLLLAEAAFPARIMAVSVDHGLRPAAAQECRFVASVCARLGVPHETMPVHVANEGEGIQSAARRSRREAFGRWCRQRHVRWMMTGHHADDQAETVLMRLARGSGVAGLSGIDAMTELPTDANGVLGVEEARPAWLIRPLLDWRRRELARIVADAGVTPIDDPSNHDIRYDRTRFRSLLASTDLIDVRRIGLTARHCADADRALGWAVQALARQALRLAPGRAELEIALLAPWHGEIMRRILLTVFSHFDVRRVPRGEQIARMVALLLSGRATTLADVKAEPRDGVWTFTPAPPRRPMRRGETPAPQRQSG